MDDDNELARINCNCRRWQMTEADGDATEKNAH